MKKNINIYTDGACQPNPGESGSGIVFYENGTLKHLWFGGYQKMATNNIAELYALYYALLTVEKHIKKESGYNYTIHSDSSYSIDTLTKWAFGWEKNGWKKKSKGEIKNLELIKNMLKTYKNIKNKTDIKKVKGHSGVEGNELADRMAILAIKEKQVKIERLSEPYNINEIIEF